MRLERFDAVEHRTSMIEHDSSHGRRHACRVGVAYDIRPMLHSHLGDITGWKRAGPCHRSATIHKKTWTFNLPGGGKCAPHLLRTDRRLEVNVRGVYFGCACAELSLRCNKQVTARLPWPSDLDDQSSTVVGRQRQSARQAPTTQPALEQVQIQFHISFPPAGCTRCDTRRCALFVSPAAMHRQADLEPNNTGWAGTRRKKKDLWQ